MKSVKLTVAYPDKTNVHYVVMEDHHVDGYIERAKTLLPEGGTIISAIVENVQPILQVGDIFKTRDGQRAVITGVCHSGVYHGYLLKPERNRKIGNMMMWWCNGVMCDLLYHGEKKLDLMA
jgi:hypothetical protein